MPHPFPASTASKYGLRLLYGFSLLLLACTWQPSARPVQPEQVFEGAARVDALLGREGRYALVQAGTITPGSAEAADVAPGSGALKHFRVVDTQGLTFCSLPPEYAPASGSLVAPNLRDDAAAKLWLPLRTGDGQLSFTDEECVVKGPFGKLDRPLTTLALRGDAREVLLSLNAGELTLIDPWTDTTRLLAREVDGYQVVDADTTVSAQARAPEAVWLLEGPRLTQRGLDGTLLLALGEDVQEFVQQRFSDGLRVAFRDGADLYEAKAPSFVPVLIAENACDALYRSTSLDLHFPCSSRQLVRIDLLTGMTRTFAPGVTEAFSLGDIEVERARDASNQLEIYAALKNGPRVRVTPIPAGTPSLLDRTRLAGVAVDGRFGVWNLSAEFVSVLSGVRELRAFRGARSNELEWLVLHDVQNGIGRVSTFTQRDVDRALADRTETLALRTLAEGVPLTNGYRIAGRIGAEPVVLTLEQSTQLPDKRFAGTLHARLLSGTLEARIDEGVSSNLLVVAPQPAVLYGISEGERSGLWFAAL
ncbi:MAG: hypothetical protein ABW252_07545 [Polyangiales bacterium]